MNEFSFEKQRLLISYMVSNQELYVKVSPILNSAYFDPRLKNAVKFIQSYFEEFKSPPNTDQIRAETSITLDKTDKLSRQEFSYTEIQLEQFCRQEAINDAIMRSPALVNEGKYGEVEKLIKNAITVSINRNIGTDYFADPEQRLQSLALSQNNIPTMFLKLDNYLNGGINRKEMIIFAAGCVIGTTKVKIVRKLTPKSKREVCSCMEK